MWFHVSCFVPLSLTYRITNMYFYLCCIVLSFYYVLLGFFLIVFIQGRWMAAARYEFHEIGRQSWYEYWLYLQHQGWSSHNSYSRMFNSTKVTYRIWCIVISAECIFKIQKVTANSQILWKCTATTRYISLFNELIDTVMAAVSYYCCTSSLRVDE